MMMTKVCSPCLFHFHMHCLFVSFLFLFSFPSSTFSLCNLHDSSALLLFKNSFALNTSSSSPHYQWLRYFCSFSSKTESWKNGTDCCEWDGVTCDTISGHVIGLDLSCSYLQGQFHPNSTIFKLRHLQHLNLAFNDFSGSSLYSGIGDLVNLMHLNLSNTGMSGDIPSTISHLSKLVSLDLSAYYLTFDGMRVDGLTWKNMIENATNLRELSLDGVDMSSIGESSSSLLMNLSSSLITLTLSDTQLHGNLSSHILYLPNLQILDLSWNIELRGELPKSNWTTPLRYLDISLTTLSGHILNSIGHLKSLNRLSLGNCNLEGLIPSSLFNLTQLSGLDLSYNQLVGPIPSEINQLPKLRLLDLSGNMLNGTIPRWCYSTPSLTELYLHVNYLTGSLGEFSTYSLESLDLSGNKLQGHIPNSIGHLKSLESLFLSNCNLEGLIPSSLFNLTQLSFLELSNNKLVGPIPSEINQLPKLRLLGLSGNMLNGTIPRWCYSSPSLSYLFLHENYLTGSLGEFSTYSLEYLDLSGNKLQGNFPNSLFELGNLTRLDLQSNVLSGLVNFHPSSKLKNLYYLDLSHNNFRFINFDNSVDYILPNLRDLYLSSNNISGFPKFLAKLQNLEVLDLSYNKIRGSIPKLFREKLLHSWKNIFYVDLSFNKLQGDLPIPPSGIEHFSVSNNELTGDIPSTMCNASSLATLNLAHNNLTGLIPQCLATFPSLSLLHLQMNNLYGNMPQNFSKENAFETIKLNGNRLEGPLPQSLAHCAKLEVLDLGNNNIEDTFPHWLKTLPELQVLSLRSNKFHGVITCFGTKHPFPSLKIFDVSNNNFSGPLPASCIKNFQGMMNVNDSQTSLKYMGNHNLYDSYKYNDSVVVVMKGQYVELVRILTTFTTIDLSNNMFEGEIPFVIGELLSLKGLNLSHNAITGTIPQSMGYLRNLEWLDLSFNQLIGEIPMALTNLNFLAVFNLSENHLEGSIPTGRQFDTFGNDSYGGNPKLCGIPLSKLCNEDEEWPPHSTLEHEKSGFGWKAVVVGYACGVLFGMLLGCSVFMTGKPQWLARLVEALLNERVRKTKRRGRK